MSGNEKDNSDFEFIKEQVIEKKYKKFRKKILPFIRIIFMAILFGVIAAFTFVIAEPIMNRLLHKEDDINKSVNFPTITPQEQNPTDTSKDSSNDSTGNHSADADTEDGNQTGQADLQQKIDLELDDYKSIFLDMQSVMNEVDKSLVNIVSTFTVEDWFGGSEKLVHTTGVIVANNNSQYLILASLDRIKNADSVKVKFSDTIYVDAVMQDCEEELNLALITLSIKDIPEPYAASLKVAELGESYSITAGNPVIAVGNPNGYTDSVDVGIVTCRGIYTNITDNRVELFHTNMDTNNNSDGVVINLEGKIIGVITRTLKDSLNEDLPTAIGISKIKQLIIQMGNQEPRIYFGIKTDDLTESVKKQYDVLNGIYVNEVLEDSPAYKADIREGDIILSVNDQFIYNTNNFYNIITSNKEGDIITVKLKRTTGTSEREMEIKAALAVKPK